MRILITGAAGFVGCKIVQYLSEYYTNVTLFAIDNLSRRGGEHNLPLLKKFNCKFFHGDVRNKEDLEDLPVVDWIIDCAANPSVLAGLQGGSLGLINNNLTGTINLLDKCRKNNAGFIMLSTSRVYSIEELNRIPLAETVSTYIIQPDAGVFPEGCSLAGIAENFSTAAPISLYGATKLSSEILAMEYHYSFGFPVWINRCGVIAGAGQLGKIDQGIFSFWIYQYLLDNPLSYIGFNGEGKQARDMLHPRDVFSMIKMQLESPEKKAKKIINLGGGKDNTYSLAELDLFCKMHIKSDKIINKIKDNRSFDIPLYISDCTLALEQWSWQPVIQAKEILKEILEYGYLNPEHLKRIF